MRPTIFCFKKACRGIESQPTERWRMSSVRYGVNLVHHDVDMEVLLVVVSDDHVQVFVEPKLLQCVQGSIGPLCARRTFTWRPRQFVMEHCIVATRVEEFKRFHLRCCCVDADEVAGQYDISSQPGIARNYVALSREVVEQPLETTSGFALARLDFRNHVGASVHFDSVPDTGRISGRCRCTALDVGEKCCALMSRIAGHSVGTLDEAGALV